MDRRQALRFLAAGAAAPAVVSPVEAEAPPRGSRFLHGVASGDPTSDSVVIWTRVTPPATSDRPLSVAWTVAADAGFRRIAAQGVTQARAERDFTVKVDVPGLKPGASYWYRFAAASEASPTGRACTLPDGPTESLVLAVVSCANHEYGLFNTYNAIAALPRVDMVVHLGDYIYEDGPEDSLVKRGIGRTVEPNHELITLADYRTRHAQYKRDPDLQAAHARTAWICTWDDHEAANNCWSGGVRKHDPATEGPWTARKAAAIRAYYEWMPLREPAAGRAFDAINRSFHFGDLASLTMLETRFVARADQLDYDRDMAYAPGPDGEAQPDFAAFEAKLNDPGRQMLGPGQQTWLAGELRASVAAGRTWQLLGSQVVMARVSGPNIKTIIGPAVSQMVLATLPKKKRAKAQTLAEMFARRTPYNLDAWDGYPAARERIYQAFTAAGARPIVLSGDSHAFWANELRDQAGARVGVEFGAAAASGAGVCDYVPGLPVNSAFQEANPEVRFCDHGAKGFVVLTVTPKMAVAELVAVSTRAKPYRKRVLKRFRVTPRPAGGVSALTEA